jgi:NADP-dependent 3-hydroxy acid dehydrogenase YdfG
VAERRLTALVTGASRGIGRAIARRLSGTHHIIATARTRPELESLADEIRSTGGSCDVVELDVADPAAIARTLDGVDTDILVNNAGVGYLKPLLELTPDEWNTMVDVNFNALFHVTRAVLPGMVARGAGHIVMVASIAGRSAFVGGSCYAATKHAVMGFSESLMLEVRDRGVKVSVVSPGSVATTFSRRERDTSWMLTADDVAEAVAHAIDTPPRVLVHRIEVRAAAPKKG